VKMVKLHIKKGDESQFLCETTVDVLVDEVLANIVAVYNGRLKVQRICAGLFIQVVLKNLINCAVSACHCCTMCKHLNAKESNLKTFTNF